ncbi:flavodoxin family protein [Dehalococcoides mccartyi]|uniref:NADPH-dependent FMN reductase n=1 Tax=Dehalococcoides mccartyi (strain ATCC BAA-2266 / KCTC 15142 / 195) TaxID=243164 RepID=Q3Z6R7_DEHM1|nr:flavodoxin family protein [Dehalococcoides mccartyi]AAW39369.1 NADPH-dependent FMN reductase [Dehalococcoides mccartyi 195]MBF4481944.1 flavodoxin family protein [Dehalococcoides mccartyi]MBJ7531300.1 flavodoxin family protein [Dehalococcoides mccartyi]
MRVLGLSGSPRLGGNSDTLLHEAIRGAKDKGAETHVIYLSDLDIGHCPACDDCFYTGECRYRDDMDEVISQMEKADRIIVSSPIHFMGVSSQLKVMIDRCQSLWARKYKLKTPPLGDDRERKGMFVAAGGMKNGDVFEGARATMRAFFAVLNVKYTYELLISGVDNLGAIQTQSDTLKKAYELGQMLAEK